MTSTSAPIPTLPGLRRPRAVGILLASMIIVGLTYVLAVVRPGVSSTADIVSGDPATLGAGSGIAGSLTPGSLEQIDRSIAAWSANLAGNAGDFLSATNLALLYHGRGQLSGNLEDHERGLAAARTALTIEPTYAQARALEASILYTLHAFEGALASASALYQEDPTQLGALATRADAELELGRIDDARRDLERLAAQAAGPQVDVRLARLAFVTGDPGEANRLALAARDAVRAQAAASGALDLGFYEFAAGEYARLSGDAVTARAGFEAALAIRRLSDIGALVGLARIDAFEGNVDYAIAGLRAAVAIAPQPESLSLLGDLLTQAGDNVGASEAFETVRFIGRLGAIQGAVYDRQLLRFELDHDGATAAILDAARESLAARPDATGHDLVAWALYRLGRYHEAAVEIEAARSNGADDARLRFHDGAIAIALGDHAEGLALIESALADGPAIDPIERAEATRLLAGG